MPQYEFPVAKEAFNLTHEETPAPKDNAGRVYVITCKGSNGNEYLAYNGLLMTLDEAELCAQQCRQIWKEITYTVKKLES